MTRQVATLLLNLTVDYQACAAERVKRLWTPEFNEQTGKIQPPSREYVDACLDEIMETR